MSLETAEQEIEKLRERLAKAEAQRDRFAKKVESVKEAVYVLCEAVNGRHSGCSCCAVWDDGDDDGS